MRVETFEKAAFELLEGWDRVSVLRDEISDSYQVRLLLTNQRLQEARWDRQRLLAQLFNRGRVKDLVSVIERNRGSGLRWYGRRRR